MKAPANTEWPVLVPKGRGPVKIYKVDFKGEEFYSVDFYLAGRRHRKAHSDFQVAMKAAKEAASKLTTGEADALTLTGDAELVYTRALEALKELQAPLDIVAAEYAATKKLCPGVELKEMAMFWNKHHLGVVEKTVSSVVEEMLTKKREDGASDEYLRGLRYRLRRFAKAFSMPIISVSGPHIDTWLRGQKLAPKTRNNFRSVIYTLAEYAKSRKYLPKDWNELEAVSVAKKAVGKIGIFTVDELQLLLTAANEEQLPFIAIGAFAGLRQFEMLRLHWENIDFQSNIIKIEAGQAKTAGRRFAPLTPNLAAWLAAYKDKTGPVCTRRNMAEEIIEIAGRAGVEWKHNGLRHSFISYRVAQLKNVAEVALEAGNSPQIIFKNYRELVKPEQAKAWFEITPERPANLIPLPVQAAVA
jgi:integrase